MYAPRMKLCIMIFLLHTDNEAYFKLSPNPQCKQKKVQQTIPQCINDVVMKMRLSF